jgi:hypothetical protein
MQVAEQSARLPVQALSRDLFAPQVLRCRALSESDKICQAEALEERVRCQMLL